MNLLRKFKSKEAHMRFLVWKKQLFYQEKLEDPFKHVLFGNVLKGVNRDTNTEQAQITSLFQIGEDRLYVRAPAVWHRWDKAYLDAKMKN